MYRSWNGVVGPILSIVRPRRIVEVGAGHGRNTACLLDYCARQDAVLDVIDPQPLFPYADWEKRHAGRLRVHRGRSLDVLPGLDAPDAVLLDGDHNWFTVHRELSALDDKATGTAEKPLILLHDMQWPYDRRDTYWDVSDIPPEFVQPHARGGVLPDHPDVHPRMGINRHMIHATARGGPRNGVRTAAEDFQAERPGWSLRVIAGMHGVGVLVPSGFLESHPALSAFLDAMETANAHLEELEAYRARREAEAIGLADDVCDLERRAAEASATAAAEMAEMAAAAERRKAEMETLQRELERFQAGMEWKERESDILRAELARMLRSRSWRLTAPLRRMQDWLRWR